MNCDTIFVLEDAMYKVLLVEDNEMIVKGLRFSLEQNAYTVTVAYSYKEAVDRINNAVFDLLILDITLPDGDGLELGKEIKKQMSIPIMFLTAKDDEEVIVAGLEVGEEYMVKPFRTKELLFRIQKILKRSESNTKIKVENVVVDIDKAEVIVDGKVAKFTSLEYRILALLFQNLNKVITREVILEQIWDVAGNFVNDNTLSVYIKRIREKLHNDNLVKTIKGIGYRVDRK